jgi:2-polyprenyl-6-methoxyphenol hydroxylase-like FAD-dependent oxidoreductase
VTLGSYGVDTLVVERRQSTSTMPRATVASMATMELLRRWGLEERAWERSIDVEWRAWACATLADADRGQAVEVGLPTREQATLVSPTAPACLAQDELEPLLEEHLRSVESVELERGVELIALEPIDGGYLLTLAGPDASRRVRARYVIGADGLRSSVRDAIGIDSEGDENVAERLAVMFRGPVWELVREHRYGIYFIDGDRSFLPAGKPDRWIFAMERNDVPTTEQLTRWIRDAAGDRRLPIAIESVMPVTFGTGLAARFREGDVFLVGDAAHRVTPRGGTGLNTAIRDGFDIGWKLAWVLRGWAHERLLESYERDRRPVAKFNTERSSRADGSILNTAVGLNADIGGRIAHVWVPRDGGLASTLDLLGDGLTLFLGPEADDRPGEAWSAPVTTVRLDAIAARGLGLSMEGALVATPDGFPIDLWRSGRETKAILGKDAGRERGSRNLAMVPQGAARTYSFRRNGVIG